MAEYLAQLTEMLLVLLGAVVAFGGQFAFHRWRSAHRLREIALALEEELRGTAFRPPHFSGFHDEAFSTFLADIPMLPHETARRILRYYFRMRYLRHQQMPGGDATEDSVAEMETIRNQLLGELKPISPSSSR
ncbi:MAG: hypothetical protein IH968_13970 [Gemmatimonadetes bacterium]|nr:hypothetical protein [Gemmatimonadota bacterium]